MKHFLSLIVLLIVIQSLICNSEEKSGSTLKINDIKSKNSPLISKMKNSIVRYRKIRQYTDKKGIKWVCYIKLSFCVMANPPNSSNKSVKR
jgi:hypothetical protein